MNQTMDGKWATVSGTVSRDFSSLFFFINPLLLVLVDKPENDLNFLKLFKDLLDYVDTGEVENFIAVG